MLKWIIILLTGFCISAYSAPVNENSDGIGTFLGGDDPFPWREITVLPGDLAGIWEVREADDGAYFILNEERDEASGKSKIKVFLLDPCTLNVKASGAAYVRNGVLQTTLLYPESDLRVQLKLQAFRTKSAENMDSPQVVLMVMNSAKEKQVDKYFPVSKVSIPDLVGKCK